MIYEYRMVYDKYFTQPIIYNNLYYYPIIRYHPCIKYQIPADLEMDGTDTFIVAESMKFSDIKKILWRDPHRWSPQTNTGQNIYELY